MTLPSAWLVLIEEVNGRPAFGAPGVRDPAAPCHAFDPVAEIDWLGLAVTAPGTGDCVSDGHYLCRGCARLSIDRAHREDRL